MRKTLTALLLLVLSSTMVSAQLFGPQRPDNVPKEFWKELSRDTRKGISDDYQDAEAVVQAQKQRTDGEDFFFIPPGEQVSIPLTAEVEAALQKYAPSSEPNWGRAAMGAPAATAELAKRIANQPYGILCIIDTGEPDHAELQGFILKQFTKSYIGTDPLDKQGHATHVAGSIVGVHQGKLYGILSEAALAGRVKIVAKQVCNQSGQCSTNAIAQAVRDFADETASLASAGHKRAINLSLGGPSTNATLQSALEYAEGKGVAIFAATGNNGGTPEAFPGRSKNTQGIAAVDSKLKRANFSQYGQNTSFAGPGVLIPSTCVGSTACVKSGTSMATPHVAPAGLGAWMLYPELSLPELYAYMRTICKDLQPDGYDQFTGWGLPMVQKILDTPPGEGGGDPDPDPDPEDPKRPARSVTFAIEGDWSIVWHEVGRPAADEGDVLPSRGGFMPFLLDMSTQGYPKPFQATDLDGALLMSSSFNRLYIDKVWAQSVVEGDAVKASVLFGTGTSWFFSNRGLGLPQPSDAYDALYWTSYFLEQQLQRFAPEGLQQLVNVVLIEGRDDKGNTVVYRAPFLRHWRPIPQP